MKYIGTAIVALVLFAFYYYGFFAGDPGCDPIDKQYLWCHLHPTMWYDVLGVVFFTIAAVIISAFPPLQKISFLDPEDGKLLFWSTGLLAFGGIVLMFI